MAGITTRFEVLPPLEEWHLNLEVGSQVYEFLKALSNFGKQPYGLTLCPYCPGEGFRTGFEKALPQVVTAPHRLRGFSSTPAHNFHLEEYERNYLSPYVLSFTRGGDRFWRPITEIGFIACQLKPRSVYFSESGTGCT